MHMHAEARYMRTGVQLHGPQACRTHVLAVARPRMRKPGGQLSVMFPAASPHSVACSMVKGGEGGGAGGWGGDTT